MPKLTRIACPSCSAPLPPIPDTARQVECPYCHTVLGVDRPGQTSQPADAPGQEPRMRIRVEEAEAARSGRAGLFLSVLIGFVLISVLGSVFVPLFVGCGSAVIGVSRPLWQAREALRRRPEPPAATSADPSTAAPPREGGTPSRRPTAGLAWSDQYAVPAVADVNGDGIADLLGPFRKAPPDDDVPAYVGAFSGRDGEPLWEVGPLAGPATRQVGLVVTGDRVVVQEPWGVVSVLELATGKRIAQHQLSENQPWARLCRLTPDGTQVMVDDQMIVDASTGTARTTGVPSWSRRPLHCRERRPPWNTTDTGEQASEDLMDRRRRRGPGFSVARHRILQALRDPAAGDGAAILEPSSGPPAPVVMGFDAATLEERWRAPWPLPAEEGERVPEPDLEAFEVAEGVVMLAGRADNRTRIALLDAEDGATRWVKDLPRCWSLNGVTVAGGRVWAACWGGDPTVRVLDVADGEDWTFGGP
jgi:hypothetical protein